MKPVVRATTAPPRAIRAQLMEQLMGLSAPTCDFPETCKYAKQNILYEELELISEKVAAIGEIPERKSSADS